MENELDLIFKSRLPDTLYQNHYELAEDTPFTPEEWRQYIQKNRPFIELELAAITEAKARSALQRLGTGKASSAEVAALRQLLDRSQIINQKLNAKQNIVMTFMPNPTKPKPKEEIE